MMSTPAASMRTPLQQFFQSDLAIISAVASLKLLLHLAAIPGYGYFRDELYYFACAEHLAWGYVDQPPFSIFILWLWRSLFGEGIFALRLLPALCGVATVVLTGLMVRDLNGNGGGKKTAVLVATLAVLIAPVYLAMNAFYSMNSFDILFWTLAEYLIVRIINAPSPATPLWLWLGVVLGLGLLNKISVLWLGAGIAAGLVLTSNRKLLLTKEPYLAGAVAVILFLPHVVWQVQNAWPTLEFIRNASTEKYIARSSLAFIGEQVLLMNPPTVVVWLLGLFYVFFTDAGARFRWLGVIYLTVLVILLFNSTSKAEYLSPAYPMLFAAGGVYLESRLEKFKWTWTKAVYPALLFIGLFFAPIGLPILPVETFIAYSKRIGINPPNSEGKKLGALPQHYADRFGWENMAATVATVYRTLSPDEQRRCGIYGQNYGEAGAIDFFGARLGLPKAMSGHNNYFLWSTRGQTPEILIVIGGDPEDHRKVFADVRLAATIDSDYAMPYETNLPVYLCRSPRVSLSSVWPKTKHYN